MRIRRISFVGVKTDAFDAMTAFTGEVLGLTPALQQTETPPAQPDRDAS